MRDFRHGNGAHLPNTLALELFLEHRARGRPGLAGQIRRIVAGIEAFCGKFRGATAYSLCGASQLRGLKIESVLAAVTTQPGIPIEFVSRAELANGTDQERAALAALLGTDGASARKRKRLEDRIRLRQKRLLSLAMREPVRSHFFGSRRTRPVEYRDPDGRTLENIVSLSIGTRPLLDALDQGFGNAFSHVFKDDIVAMWTTACLALIDGAKERLAAMLALAEMIRITFPIVLLRPRDIHPLTGRSVGEPRWLMMVA